jgi:thiamine-monophosphate kinase
MGRDHLGDDAAFLPSSSDDWAISVDQQIEGAHYPSELDPRAAGRRLVAVCLSDLAACGAQPVYATLTVALPAHFPARRLLEGVLDGCDRHGVTLAGGDTASTRGPAVSTLTVFGRRPGGGHWLRRSAARPGDTLWLGGTVGESALGRALLAAGATASGRRVHLPAGLAGSGRLERLGKRAVRRHLLPTPQFELGRALGRRRRVAALDVSDGLALDLHRLCAASGVGAQVEAADLPEPEGLSAWAERLGQDHQNWMLGGGEDYVLLFTLPPSSRRPTPDCRRIGAITTSEEVKLLTSTGARALEPIGWDHLAEPGG